MLVKLPISYGYDQEPLPMSFIISGDNLQLRPNQGQHYTGHSNQGKYNSAYSIGFCCDTYPSMFDVCYDVMYVRNT